MEIVEIIIKLLVGLVVFVTGMNLMSSGLKASAGRVIRRLFKKIKNNKIAAASIGAGTTAIIQSSGATTVMVVGFLATGALTFAQGFSIMLGAFLGTTVTGLFVSFSSFSFSIFLMALAFVGFVLGFFKNVTVKSISEILVGFGILFFGLEAMKKRNEEKTKLLYDYLDNSKLFVGTVEKNSRSLMNVPFIVNPAVITNPEEKEALEAKFVAESKKAGLENLKGHRTVGGMRASIYNAMPKEGVIALIEFMKKFEKENLK